jgi:hypothetical protein
MRRSLTRISNETRSDFVEAEGRPDGRAVEGRGAGAAGAPEWSDGRTDGEPAGLAARPAARPRRRSRPLRGILEAAVGRYSDAATGLMGLVTGRLVAAPRP